MNIVLILWLLDFFGRISSFNLVQENSINNVPQAQLSINPSALSTAFTDSQKLRIFIDYQDSFNALPDAQYFKDNVVTPAVTYLQNAISPKSPLSIPILVDRDCYSDYFLVNGDPNKRVCITDCNPITNCSSVTIPSKYLKKCLRQVSPGNNQYSGTDGAGVSGADIAILVVATVCGSVIEASAVSCYNEPSLDRPILGVMTLCQDKWNPRFNIAMNINTIRHEIIHALGFAADKFAYYRDANGSPYTPRDVNNQPNQGYNSVGGFYTFSPKVAVTVQRFRSSVKVSSRLKTVTALTLPTLLAEARSHFGCPTLTEVDLTDTAAGKVNSHFSKLFAGNELMTANADAGEGLTSRLTLSLLQDTGWYNVDLTQAQNYTYGKGLGCDFLLRGCYEFITKNPTNMLPFCNALPTGYAMKCSDDRRYIYSCNIFKNIGLDPNFVYFNQLPQLPAGDNANYYSGEDPYKEYCPMNAKITYSQYTTDCNIVNNNLRTDTDFQQWNDYYGSDSKCFDTTPTAWTVSTPTAYTPSFYGAKCFQYKCDSTVSTLYVYVNGKIVCQTTTQTSVNKITLSSLVAYINCPTYANVCVNASVSGSVTTSISLLPLWIPLMIVYSWVFR